MAWLVTASVCSGLSVCLCPGMSCAAIDTSAMAIIAGAYAGGNHFGAVLGMVESFYSLGWVVGPIVGGTLAQRLGFGAPFFAVALVAGAFLPVASFLVPADGARCAVKACVPYPVTLKPSSTRSLPWQSVAMELSPGEQPMQYCLANLSVCLLCPPGIRLHGCSAECRPVVLLCAFPAVRLFVWLSLYFDLVHADARLCRGAERRAAARPNRVQISYSACQIRQLGPILPQSRATGSRMTK
jgi:MFS family permease